MATKSTLDRATLAGGCFWCVEAALEELPGVVDATSGYCGGTTVDPTYEAVCSGSTGHAEAVQVRYDPDRLAYVELLEAFFAIHDPTTENRQGPDVGSQYRSAVFYHDEEQREAAEAYVETLEAEGADGIVTEIVPLETFYEAEDYHQDYYAKNPNQPYCAAHIPPKLETIRAILADRIDA